MMLTVICYNCGYMDSLRGWVEKEDLIGTEYESRINTITEQELDELQEKGEIKDEMDKFEENPICPECGSKNVKAF